MAFCNPKVISEQNSNTSFITTILKRFFSGDMKLLNKLNLLKNSVSSTKNNTSCENSVDLVNHTELLISILSSITLCD